MKIIYTAVARVCSIEHECDFDLHAKWVEFDLDGVPEDEALNDLEAKIEDDGYWYAGELEWYPEETDFETSDLDDWQRYDRREL